MRACAVINDGGHACLLGQYALGRQAMAMGQRLRRHRAPSIVSPAGFHPETRGPTVCRRPPAGIQNHWRCPPGLPKGSCVGHVGGVPVAAPGREHDCPHNWACPCSALGGVYAGMLRHTGWRRRRGSASLLPWQDCRSGAMPRRVAACGTRGCQTASFTMGGALVASAHSAVGGCLRCGVLSGRSGCHPPGRGWAPWVAGQRATKSWNLAGLCQVL